MWNEYLKSLLKKKYQLLKAKNTRFSVRAFSKKVGLSPGAYSDFVSGRRKVSAKKALQIAGRLSLTPSEEKKLKDLIDPSSRQLMPEETFKLIANWHYLAILAAFEIADPPRRPEEFAQRLSLPLSKVVTALKALMTIGFVEESESGDYHFIGHHLTTTDNIPSEAIRSFHLGSLKNAESILSSSSSNPAEYDFNSVTFAGSSKDMARAKKEIRRFRDRICAIMSGPSKNHVYKFSVQLFPLTQKKSSHL